jgi:hypothetical protein
MGEPVSRTTNGSLTVSRAVRPWALVPRMKRAALSAHSAAVLNLAPDHVDFIKRQHRIKRRMNDEQGYPFRHQPLDSFGPQFKWCVTRSDQNGVYGSTSQQEFPFVRTIG